MLPEYLVKVKPIHPKFYAELRASGVPAPLGARLFWLPSLSEATAHSAEKGKITLINCDPQESGYERWGSWEIGDIVVAPFDCAYWGSQDPTHLNFFILRPCPQCELLYFSEELVKEANSPCINCATEKTKSA